MAPTSFITHVSFFLGQEPSQSCGDVTLRIFDRLVVRISLDSQHIQHQKLAIQLVQPKVGQSYISIFIRGSLVVVVVVVWLAAVEVESRALAPQLEFHCKMLT